MTTISGDIPETPESTETSVQRLGLSSFWLSMLLPGFFYLAGGWSPGVHSAIPQTMAYQGKLTDAAGGPLTDGAHLVKFTIYDDSLAGVMQWTSGFQPVTTTGGVFFYQLGSLAPLPDDIFQTDTVRFLGLTVGVDPEIEPRTRLLSVAYSYQSLRADSADVAAVADNALLFDGLNSSEIVTEAELASHVAIAEAHHSKTSDAGELTSGSLSPARYSAYADLVEELKIGSAATQVATGDHQHSGAEFSDSSITGIKIASQQIARAHLVPDAVGSTEIEDGSVTTADLADNLVTSLKLAPDAVNSGHIALNAVGQSELANNSVTSAQVVDNSITGTDIADNSLTGTDIQNASITGLDIASETITGAHIATGSVTGSDLAPNSVGIAEISSNSVAADEVLDNSLTSVDLADEPGISENVLSGGVLLSQGAPSMVDLVTTTITTPEVGFILVRGSAYFQSTGTASRNQVFVQIDETAGGSAETPHYTWAGAGSHTSSSPFHYFPLSRERVFTKPAGTYTFRMEALTHAANGSGAVSRIWYPTLVAVYIPSAYGAVAAVPGVADDQPGSSELSSSVVE